jgi:hypothetical protein
VHWDKADACENKLESSLTPRVLGFTGGGGGIRTPETLSSLTVFKTAGFNRSPTPPFLSITCNSTLWSELRPAKDKTWETTEELCTYCLRIIHEGSSNSRRFGRYCDRGAARGIRQEVVEGNVRHRSREHGRSEVGPLQMRGGKLYDIFHIVDEQAGEEKLVRRGH